MNIYKNILFICSFRAFSQNETDRNWHRTTCTEKNINKKGLKGGGFRKIKTKSKQYKVGRATPSPRRFSLCFAHFTHKSQLFSRRQRDTAMQIFQRRTSFATKRGPSPGPGLEPAPAAAPAGQERCVEVSEKSSSKELESESESIRELLHRGCQIL